MKKEKKIAKLKKDLDAVFSQYIRKRDGGRCFTCGKIDDVKKMQNGHFVQRHYLATRYDERNNHCQCIGCNLFKNGNMAEYAERLCKKYGPEILEQLNLKKHSLVKYNRAWYEEQIAYYKGLL